LDSTPEYQLTWHETELATGCLARAYTCYTLIGIRAVTNGFVDGDGFGI